MAVKTKLTPIAGAVASAVVLALSTPAAAQPAGSGASPRSTKQGTAAQGTAGASTAARSQQTAMEDMRASRLLGKDLRNAQGEKLGEIRDMVVDLSGQRIHYAILEHGGVGGIGDRQVAVPVTRIRTGARDGELVLNMTAQQLKDAPRLERTAEWSDPRTWDSVGQHYTRTLGMSGVDRPAAAGERGASATGPSGTGASSAAARPSAGSGSGAQPGAAGTTQRLVRASDLLGMDVLDRAGDEVGEIEDIVVNLSNGTIHYAVLEFDRKWNPVDKLVALPMSSLQPKAGGNDLTINMSREQLANAPSFEPQKWPDLKDSQFRDRVAGFGRSSTTGMERPGAATAPGSGSTPSSAASPGSTPSPGAAPSPGATPSPGSGTGASGSASPPLGTTGPGGSSGSGSGGQPR